MKYYIENKLVSLRGSSTVKDEYGNEAFTVKGKFFTCTRKKYLYLNDKPVFMIRNKFWRFLRRSAFLYDLRGEKPQRYMQLRMNVFKGFTVLKCKDEITVGGSFFSAAEIVKNGKVIARFARKGAMRNLFLNDAFELDVLDENETMMLLAFVIAYDNLFDERLDDCR